MRCSFANQIEYLATLGQIVEHSGRSEHHARTAIVQYVSCLTSRGQVFLSGLVALAHGQLQWRAPHAAAPGAVRAGLQRKGMQSVALCCKATCRALPQW